MFVLNYMDKSVPSVAVVLPHQRMHDHGKNTVGCVQNLQSLLDIYTVHFLIMHIHVICIFIIDKDFQN